MACRCGGGDWPGKAGRTEAAGELGGHKGPADAAPDFVSDDRRGREASAVDPLLLRERKQWRQDDDTQMTDAAGVHILADEAVSGDAVGEDGVSSRRADIRADDRTRSRARRRQRRRLTGPGKRRRLESAGKEIKQANPELAARLRGKMVVALRDDTGREPRRKRAILNP